MCVAGCAQGLQSTASGAMLLGSSAFITEARQWQHRMGGRLWSQLPLILAAERALNTNIGSFAKRADKLRQVTAALMDAQTKFVQSKENDEPKLLLKPMTKKKAIATAAVTGAEGADNTAGSSASSVGAVASSAVSSPASAPASTPATTSSGPFHPFFSFVPPIPTCSMVHMSLRCSQPDAEWLRDAVNADCGIVLFNRVRAASSKECLWEWNMGTANCEIPVDTVVRGWNAWMHKRYEQMREAHNKAQASM